MRAVSPRRLAALILPVAFCLLSLSAVASGSAHQSAVNRVPATVTSTPEADALDVYFRHDSVGQAQRALAMTTCGTERWTVKTGTDDDRHKIATTAHDFSIRYLRSRPTPAYRPETSRVAPVERTTYRVHTRLIEFVREADSDYHLVLADHQGRTMVVEIPAPSCVGKISPFRAGIRSARRAMDARFAVTSDFKHVSVPVIVRGVGFFDYFHGQTGMAPNDLELHPVTGLSFG
jgi:hypothetical protein